MSETLALAALIVRECVDDENSMGTVNPTGLRSMAIAAKDEHDSLRARITELEKENTRLHARMAEADDANEGLVVALRAEQVGRLAAEGERNGAEAERDRLRERLDQFAAHGAETVAEMLDMVGALRDERDRYLAVIVEWVEAQNETVGDPSPKAWCRKNDAHLALRRIAEEKP